MVAVELSRLLRRGLLVIATAVAGWLLSALFATSAAADDGTTSTQSSGLLGGLLGGVTDTLTGLTDTVVDVTGTVLDTTVDTAAAVLAPPPQQPAPAPAPIIDLPQLLPVHDGAAETDREVPAPAAPAPTPAPAPVVAPPVVPAPVPAPTPRPAAPAAQPAPLVQVDDAPADSHTDQNVPEPRPVKAPATPAGPAPTAAPSHDTSGGARGTHGLLPAQATLHPADAGFTTRSRAVGAAGRGAGLPASSPD